MAEKLSKKAMLNEVILGYRKVINDRYQYDNINSKYKLPDSFDEAKVAAFRSYFLDYLYPAPAQREELNDAFQSLDNYIKNPEKLLRILMDSASLIFKYGRHLPKILRAGIRALRSFRTGVNFENKLVLQAQSLDCQPPFNNEDINTFIGGLSPNEVEQFIENNEALFETVKDRVLVEKIKEIVEHLIAKMRERPNVYTAEEIKGLEIGRDIIVKGDALFDNLSETDQQLIFETVLKIERDVLEDIFANKEDNSPST